MNTWISILFAAAISAQAWAAAPEGVDVGTKWYRNASGFEDAVQLQKETGADILVYIAYNANKNSGGLCTWFQSKGLKHQVVSKFIKRNYIKVELTIPSNKDTEALGNDLYMSKGPSLIVIKPDGHRNKVNPFDWSLNEPRLKEANALVEELESNSSTFNKAIAP